MRPGADPHPGPDPAVRGLIGFEDGSDVVRFASRNIAEVVGRGWVDKLGKRADDLLDRGEASRLVTALALRLAGPSRVHAEHGHGGVDVGLDRRRGGATASWRRSRTRSRTTSAPFRHIVGYSELPLDEKELGERSRRFVHTIIDSAPYAGTLVDSLLAPARVGRTALHPVRVDMNRLFQDVRGDLAAEQAGRDVEWVVGELPECVCDPMTMKLVVRNLLANAIEYTRNRPHARVEVGCEPRPGESAFFVRDDGVGFDMKYVGKLCGVFQRLHRTEEYEGTGVGLANVQRIVECHGGRACRGAGPT